MTQDNALRNTIARINRVLTDAGFRFHFTGGIASTYHGEPRFTQDLDIVVGVSSELDAKKMISTLEKEYIIDSEAIAEAITKKQMFQALDKDTWIKIDFYGTEKIPNELSRTTRREIFPGIAVPLVSVEDAILSKLIWVKEGSDKASHDIKAMLSANRNLDVVYLEKNALLLGLSHLLKEFRI